eukprot:5651481-Amphidinium_carterae.1
MGAAVAMHPGSGWRQQTIYDMNDLCKPPWESPTSTFSPRDDMGMSRGVSAQNKNTIEQCNTSRRAASS